MREQAVKRKTFGADTGTSEVKAIVKVDTIICRTYQLPHKPVTVHCTSQPKCQIQGLYTHGLLWSPPPHKAFKELRSPNSLPV